MLVKSGVDISRLRPEIRKKLNIIATLMFKYGGMELVITSTYEGDHSPGSLHYGDLAIDVRTPAMNSKLVEYLSEALGDDYDIVKEKDHIHIEYDPK